MADVFDPVSQPATVGFKSKILNHVIFSLPRISDAVKEMLEAVSLEEASKGEKEGLWTNSERYPAIRDTQFVSNLRHRKIERA